MRTYYFISDLHIGGDEALGVCEFENELIDSLGELAAKRDEDVELVIIGDAGERHVGRRTKEECAVAILDEVAALLEGR